eukprot:scaffold3821_cov127-Cylindrotheca_fusiformis.AAC.12
MHGLKKHVLLGCFALCVVVLLSRKRSKDTPRLFGQYLSTKNIYLGNEPIPTWILPLTSPSTQLPLPYDTSLFCDTAEENEAARQKKPSRWIIGDNPVLRSPLHVNVSLNDYGYKFLCNKTLTEQSSSDLKYLISNRYHQNVIIDDGLPPVLVHVDGNWIQHGYQRGVPVGLRSRSNASVLYVLNHWNICVDVHQGEIIGFLIDPISIDRRWLDSLHPDQDADLMRIQRRFEIPQQKVEANETIVYTYAITIRPTLKPWSSRWQPFLNGFPISDQFHVYSIMNSVFVLVMLSVVLIVTWVRRLKQSSKLGQPLLPEEKEESNSDREKGLCCRPKKGAYQKWRLLHGDVFRPPSFSPISLAIACGTGAQLLSSTLFVCALCFLGIITPIYKGTFFVGPVLSYTFVGSWIGGFVTSIVYQQVQLDTSNIERKRMAVLCTALLCPGVIFLFFLLLNEWARAVNSTMARPIYPDILLLIILWLCVFVPMTQRGAEAGFRLGIAPFPVETSNEVRDIPKGRKLRRNFAFFLSSGIIVFGVFHVENYFLIQHFFGGYYSDSYGYVTIAICMMIAASACVSMMQTFWQLSVENHRWWWSSFGNGASVGVFAWMSYCYSFARLDLSHGGSFFAYVLYFGATLIVSVGISLAFGCVSFCSSLHFNRGLYTTMHAGD